LFEKNNGGSENIYYGSDVVVDQLTSVAISDLRMGDEVIYQGRASDDEGYTANHIMIRSRENN